MASAPSLSSGAEPWALLPLPCIGSDKLVEQVIQCNGSKQSFMQLRILGAVSPVSVGPIHESAFGSQVDWRLKIWASLACILCLLVGGLSYRCLTFQQTSQGISTRW